MIADNKYGRAVATPREAGNGGRGGGIGPCTTCGPPSRAEGLRPTWPRLSASPRHSGGGPASGCCRARRQSGAGQLSRAGLVAFVEGIGGRWAGTLDQCEALHSQSMRAEGNAALDEILGSRERVRALTERPGGRASSARAGRADAANLRPSPCPGRLRSARQPREDGWDMASHGRWSLGEPHLDFADILRRECGAGPYGPIKLRRIVRRAVARSAGFEPRGPVRWYLRFMAKPIVPMRWRKECCHRTQSKRQAPVWWPAGPLCGHAAGASSTWLINSCTMIHCETARHSEESEDARHDPFGRRRRDARAWSSSRQPPAARNPHGFGIYSPVEPPVRGRPRVHRYDPRSWYYRQPRYYPYYGSGYWVPRAEMRYRYRYQYVGPQYSYFPAWGYGCPGISLLASSFPLRGVGLCRAGRRLVSRARALVAFLGCDLSVP